MNTASNGERDYVAIILVGAGSSYARGPDKADCIARVQKIAKSDWASLFVMDGRKTTINVVDVTGHDEVWWDSRGVHVKGDPETVLPVEQVEVIL